MQTLLFREKLSIFWLIMKKKLFIEISFLSKVLIISKSVLISINILMFSLDLLDLKQKTYSENNKEENNEKKKKLIEKNGTLYNIEKLIEDSENDQKLKVKLREELIANKEKIGFYYIILIKE